MKPPDTRFLFAHPAHFVALGFGAGLIPKAPGTFGTLVAIPLFAAMYALPLAAQLVFVAALFVLGVACCARAGTALGVADHGALVWDEIVAFLLVLVTTPRGWSWWIAAFVLFRFFDIVKPWPIRQIERVVKGGVGVMLDDVIAAVFTILILDAVALFFVAS